MEGNKTQHFFSLGRVMITRRIGGLKRHRNLFLHRAQYVLTVDHLVEIVSME
jgi:hypothetical protein